MVVSEYQPKRSEQQNAFIHSRCGIALSCSIRLLSHTKATKKTLSLYESDAKNDDDFSTTFVLSLSLKKTTHRPVARVNQPRRFVRVDFRLLFPMASGIDDIRSRRGSMVAHLHDDDDGFGVRVFVLFLSLSLRVLNERSFDESERYSVDTMTFSIPFLSLLFFSLETKKSNEDTGKDDVLLPAIYCGQKLTKDDGFKKDVSSFARFSRKRATRAVASTRILRSSS